jgi:hypothetical protein
MASMVSRYLNCNNCRDDIEVTSTLQLWEMMATHVPAIFISYRRGDTLSATGRLADSLATRFGSQEIFRDVDAIEAAADFRVALLGALESAQVVLVMIGPSWLSGRAAGASKLDAADDYVRFEIEAAVTNDLPILPVLVEGARMPKPEELPSSIRALAYRQAHEISESRWRYDFERLVEILGRHTGITPASRGPTSGLARVRNHPLVAAIVGAPRDFVRLVYEPRRFLTACGAGAPGDLTRAFVFVILSQLVAGTIVVQEWPTRSPLLAFIATAPMLTLLSALALSVPLYQAWRLSGARREYRRVLVVLLYQCAFVGLGIAVATLVALIGMNMVLPDQVDQLARNPTAQTASAVLARLQSASGGEPWVITSMISGFIGLGLVVWGFVTWDSYRIALQQTRARSLMALTLFCVFCLLPLASLAWVASVL